MTDAELEQQQIRLEQQRDTSNVGIPSRFVPQSGEIKSIKQILYGVNGDNGFNGRLKWQGPTMRPMKRFTELKSKLTHYVDIERLETCHGIAAVAAHEQSTKKKKRRRRIESGKDQCGVGKLGSVSAARRHSVCRGAGVLGQKA